MVVVVVVISVTLDLVAVILVLVAVALEVVLVIVILAVVARALVCAGAVIVTFVEVLTVDMRVDLLIIVSNAVIDLLMDALTGITLCVPANIGVGVVVVMGVNLFAISGPLEGFRC